ncbi:MAG: hypothetical protein ACHQ7M_16635 [Chloroflexota bacterium]
MGVQLFSEVVAIMAKLPGVAAGGKRGFGSGALKVGGKIFAMETPRGEFVVKLPAARVAELVAMRLGKPFDAGKGRPMQGWLVVAAQTADRIALVREAYAFVSEKR